MNDTPFQRHWHELAGKWGLTIETPFVIEVADAVITVPVLLRDFGGRCGMLLVTDFSVIKLHTDVLVDLGYGYSRLFEDQPGDDESLMDMLADWGWSGEGAPPEWYREPTS